MRRFIVISLIALATLVRATETITFSLDQSTGRLSQTGLLVAGSTHTVRFVLASGAWDGTETYRLTLKGDGLYDDDPLVLLSGAAFTINGATMSANVDLNITELYTYLGRADARSVMLQLSNSQAAYFVQHRLIVKNSVERPTDTAPANPDTNAYTDAEVDAMIDAIPAGLAPVPSPIDGYTVECEDDGQIRTGNVAAVELLQIITNYAETTTLASGDYLVIWDASLQAHRKITLSTLVDYIITQLPE